MKPLNLGIIGLGRVGMVLGFALFNTIHRIVYIHDKNAERVRSFQNRVNADFPVGDPMKCDLIFICVPDNCISDIVRHLSHRPSPPQKQLVIHTSGSLGLEVLKPLVQTGRFCAVMHPLIAFPDNPTLQVDFFRGKRFGVTVDDAALKYIASIADALDAEILPIADKYRVHYHLASVFAANLPAGLMKLSSELYTQAGIDPKISEKITIQFFENVLKNLKNKPFQKAISGPLIRGDTSTINRHMEVMDKLPPHYRIIYRELSLYLMSIISEDKSEHNFKRIADILNKAKNE